MQLNAQPVLIIIFILTQLETVPLAPFQLSTVLIAILMGHVLLALHPYIG